MIGGEKEKEKIWEGKRIRLGVYALRHTYTPKLNNMYKILYTLRPACLRIAKRESLDITQEILLSYIYSGTKITG